MQLLLHFVNINKMRSYSIVILALLCISALAWTNSCPGFYEGDKLQTGKNSFINGRSGPEYNYEFPIAFSAGGSGFEIATTAATIGDYNPSSSGFSFQVNGQRKGNSNYAVFTLIAPSQGWTSIQISFLISSRDDFAVGNYQFPVNQWVQGRSTDTYDLVYTVPKSLPNGNYNIAAFISGFSTSSTQFQISINQRSYDAWNRKITLTIFCGAYPRPASITISYIIYPSSHPSLEISFGAPSGQTGAYQISGPTSFPTSNNVEYNEFRVANRYLTCTGNECDNTCVLRERCVELGGNVYEGQCIFCATGIIFEYGLCTRRCGVNQNYINRVCICASGFVRRGKDCVSKDAGPSCKGNEHVWNSGCRSCPSGSSVNSDLKGCSCNAPGTSWEPNSNSCEGGCRQGEFWDNSQRRCVCNGVYYGNQCTSCPSDATFNGRDCICAAGWNWDRNSNACRSVCGGTEAWDNVNRRCLCRSGWGRYGGQCRQCPSGSTTNNREECVCPTGSNYNANSNTCVATCNGYFWSGQCRQCPAGSSLTPDRSTCVCGNGYNFIPQSGICQLINNCPSGFIPTPQGGCVCPSTSINWRGGCLTCPSNSRPNQGQTSCICNTVGQIYDANTNKCLVQQVQCPAGYIAQGNNCVCNGYTFNRQCRKCPDGSKPNYSQNTCDCLPGFTFDSANAVCRSNCKQFEVWANNGCLCISGYARYNGICRQCPRSSDVSANGNSCVCSSKTAIYIPNSNLCVECGSGSSPNADATACVCKSGFVPSGNTCVPQIQCQFNEDLVGTECKCKYGWTQVGPICVESCGFGENWNGSGCECKQGHARITGVCRPCPPQTVPNKAKTSCLCADPLQYFNPSSVTCVSVPPNSIPTPDGNDWVCKKGYFKQGNGCATNCPSDGLPNENGDCTCTGGRFFDGSQCIAPISCPPRSTFNTATKACVCNSRLENIIDGQCKACGENSIWNTGQCVCSTGFFKIGGVCQTCDPRTKYDGKDCICNLGYFGNRDLCTPCHKSCSQCTGPEANKCKSCSDVSLVLDKGYCAKNSPCDFGFFQDGQGCTKCLDYCISCESVFECQTCSIGFKETPQTVGDQKVVSCEEICGDGIKYEHQCDDGNTANGDGCSSKCAEEPGWFCSGGSSSKSSVCKKFVPDQVQLSSKGAVNMGSHVLVSVRASYLPSCVTKLECSTCFKVIQANVVNVNMPVNVVINYVPLSQWQFVVKVDFLGAIVTSTFKMVIKLNDQFKGCIAAEDYNDQLELTVDPTFLAKSDKVDTLTLDDLDPTKITVPNDVKRLLGL